MLSTSKRAFTLLKSAPYDRQLRLLGFSNGSASAVASLGPLPELRLMARLLIIIKKRVTEISLPSLFWFKMQST